MNEPEERYYDGPYNQLKNEVASLKAELAVKTEALEAVTGRRFPVLDDARYSVPWYLVAPFEAQAKANHEQSLERLAARGGLSSIELIAAIEGHGYRWVMGCKLTEPEARARVCDLLGLDTAMQPRRALTPTQTPGVPGAAPGKDQP